jgi:serine/threonine protein kinase
MSDAGLTQTADLVGTLRYMSPEQALAKHGLVDHRTDIYSLGVTFYELMTGRPAVDGQGREEILNAITLKAPRPLRALNAAIPAELETVILKAIALEPAERYATAQELADDLRRFLEDKPIQARRPSLYQRFTCRAGCTERDVSEDRNAGPLKCNGLVRPDPPPGGQAAGPEVNAAGVGSAAHGSRRC